jgi:SAM-dependent methyltransferase
VGTHRLQSGVQRHSQLEPRPASACRRWLGDTPSRSYARKLDLFGRFAAPELRRVFADLDLRVRGPKLDLGCGTGIATALLAEQLGPGAAIVGADLSLPHLEAARRHHSLPLVQCDATALGFRDGVFDLIWACNTINHLADQVAVLRALRRHLRRGGRLVIAQSGLLPEMFFSWDSALDDAVRAACHRYYRERYGLAVADTAALRALTGLLCTAGFDAVRVRTYVIERVQPLSDADREYFEQAVFDGTWGERIEPYLEPEDREKLRRNCDRSSPDYCLDRDDFHHLQTLTVCAGTEHIAGHGGRR